MGGPGRPRRWPFVLAALGIALAIGAWWIDRQLEPQRLATLVLKKAGESLQLSISFDGTPEYALRPEPRLLIPNLRVAAARGGKPFLTAVRAEISLPWSTIKGDTPSITRVELDQPVLDIAGMRSWLATRPPKPFELPTLTQGLRVTKGRVMGDGFALSALEVDLPRLQAGEPASLDASGEFRQGTLDVAFDAVLHADTPGLSSNFTLQGKGALQRKPKPLEFTVASAGHYESTDAALDVKLASVEFAGASPLPSIKGQGALKRASGLQWSFGGTLLQWPSTWPALPKPLDAQTGNLPLRLSYAGRRDLGDPIHLVIDRDPTVLDATLRIAELQSWMNASPASPLPPINGTLRTPSLVFDGVELQGVEMEISDSAAP